MIVKEIKIEDVTREDITEVLCGECDISYWGEIIHNGEEYLISKNNLIKLNIIPEDCICYEDILTQMLYDGYKLTIVDIEDDEPPVDIKLSDLINGIEKAINYNVEWIDENNRDGYYCDSAIQMAAYGEIIFG